MRSKSREPRGTYDYGVLEPRGMGKVNGKLTEKKPTIEIKTRITGLVGDGGHVQSIANRM